MKNRAGLTLSSIICVMLGIVLIRYSDEALKTICIFLGGATIACGVILFIGYMSRIAKGLWSGLNLAGGILLTAIGIVLLMTPKFAVSIIPFIAGLVILFHSIAKIQQAIELRLVGYGKWWSMLVFGIVMLLIGAYVVFNPFDAASTMVKAIGIALLINGLLSVVGTIFTGMTVHHYKKVEEAGFRDEQTGESGSADIIDVNGNIIV